MHAHTVKLSTPVIIVVQFKLTFYSVTVGVLAAANPTTKFCVICHGNPNPALCTTMVRCQADEVSTEQTLPRRIQAICITILDLCYMCKFLHFELVLTKYMH